MRSGRILQRFNTTAGKKHYVSAWIRIDREIATPHVGGLVVVIYDTLGQKLASSPYLTTANSPVGSWTRVSLSFVAKSKQSRLEYRTIGIGQFEASADDFIVADSPIP